jgi:hypothetical protein
VSGGEGEFPIVPRLQPGEFRVVPGSLDFVPVCDQSRLRTDGVGRRGPGCRRENQAAIKRLQLEFGLPTSPPVASLSSQHGCIPLFDPSGHAAVVVTGRRHRAWPDSSSG